MLSFCRSVKKKPVSFKGQKRKSRQPRDQRDQGAKGEISRPMFAFAKVSELTALCIGHSGGKRRGRSAGPHRLARLHGKSLHAHDEVMGA